MGVTHVTISRWENGQAHPNKIPLKALKALALSHPASVSELPENNELLVRETGDAYQSISQPTTPDFCGDPELVRLVVEAERLRSGYLFSPRFATETALIDPLPHQLIAVYQKMLPQPRLRMLLADDAGAGKTIMTGLYVREMLSRHLIKRALIVSPAGLVGNWKRELRTLFSLHLQEVGGLDCRDENPFAGPGSDLIIASVDTLTGDRVFQRLAQADTLPFDLVVFDEGHKLSAVRNPDGSYETTDRYKLAELLAGAEPLQERKPGRHLSWHAHHLLLLTATPHMGKDFPYYALWRLLEPNLLRTTEAFFSLSPEVRDLHFIRRTKEEMVKFDGTRIYPMRESSTISYELNADEQELYDRLTAYVRTYYNRASFLNRSAARLAMSILQRRAASSTWALLRSLERRLARLNGYIDALVEGRTSQGEFVGEQSRFKILDVEDAMTGDEEQAEGGNEERDIAEDFAMGATIAVSLAELEVERTQVAELLDLANRVYHSHQESKLDKLREIINDERFKDEKLLIFTEHRDTMDFLVGQLEALGYTGEVARIHGGMPYPEREQQMEAFRRNCRFMVATDAAGEGINLQFCWIMINYDIPWNPARVEQRFGRIHRYKQEHDPVVLVNLVASKTREGNVLKTLLDKLDLIRRELKSDKVFDVIGRQFQGISISEIIMRAVVDEEEEKEACRKIEGTLTKEQVLAISDAEAKLRVSGGDVASHLPALLAQKDNDQLQRLLPGYVRRFLEKSAPYLGIRVEGDLAGRFLMEKLPVSLAVALEDAAGGHDCPLTVTRPHTEDRVVFLRPGEPFFDRYRAFFLDRFTGEALRGGAFVDPYAREAYVFHLAGVAVVRDADPDYPEALGTEQTLEYRLVALTQTLEGQVQLCAPELLMVLRPAEQLPVMTLPPTQQVSAATERAMSHLEAVVAEEMADRWINEMKVSAQAREPILRASFDYQEAELVEMRFRFKERLDHGNGTARKSLDYVKDRQRTLATQRDSALAMMAREPDLVRPGSVCFLAHALILPSSDQEDQQRHDREVERIAMQVAWAYEESNGARVRDVSTPQRALEAGLDQWPGFDLLAHRPDGGLRCIEVKGRRGVGDVELKENEWAKAANLRGEYWLYVVYDCATACPRLLRVSDPFAKLLVRARGGVIIDEGAVFEAAAP